MKFISPSFLYALSVLLIPIIIHLFNFRRYKKIFFSNVRFLKEVQEQTQSKSKLKHLLVLCTRLLALAFLVFAFSQPYIPATKSTIDPGEKAVSIFVDNSFSMEAAGKYGTLLDEAHKRALEIMKAYSLSDKFQLLTNDFEGKHQRLVSKEVFSQMLDEVVLSPQSRPINEVITRQLDLLNASNVKTKHIYILSDFQQSNYNISQLKNDTSVVVHFIPLTANTRDNVWIDSCWFNSPVRQLNTPDSVQVRIVNGSSRKIEDYPVKLFINGSEKVPATVTIEAGQRMVVSFPFIMREYGMHKAWIELKDYPVTYDDRFYFSFTISNKIKVMQVNGNEAAEADPITRLFGHDSLFSYTLTDNKRVNYALLASQQLLVLNGISELSSGLQQEVSKYLSQGGNVLLIPSSKIKTETYNAFLSALGANTFSSIDTTNVAVNIINFEHFLFNNVFEKRPAANMDKPRVLSHYVLGNNSRTNEQVLLDLQNSNKYLVHYPFKGNLYVLASAVSDDQTGFHKHALFVPLLYNMALYSNVAGKPYYTIGADHQINVKLEESKEHVLHITNNEYKTDIIPELRNGMNGAELYTNDQLKQAGVYELTDDKKQQLAALAFNYKRTESYLACYETEAIEAMIAEKGFKNMFLLQAGERSLSDSIAEQNYGKKLWKLCVILSLIFLALETVLLRFVKK